MRSETCTRRIQFCAGHRVHGHENKCSNVHGHNYVVFATAKAEELDDIGRVIDFSVLKERLGGWIEDCWDHGFIFYEKDTQIEEMLARVTNSSGSPCKEYVMESNPTAENMANHLLYDICPKLFKGTGVVISEIILWETENCFAKATR